MYKKFIKDKMMSIARVAAKSPQARHECGLGANNRIQMLYKVDTVHAPKNKQSQQL